MKIVLKKISFIKKIMEKKHLLLGSIVSPKIEGAIITAQGASNVEVKSNIISAVEAVTGIGSHKIQVFEMKK